MASPRAALPRLLLLLLLLLPLVLLTSLTRAEAVNASAVTNAPAPWDLVDGIDGCALCRGGDCSRAVNNQSAGVFCGELQGSHQPCCCAYVTTCAVDQFYDSCQCKEPDQLERALFAFWRWGLLALAAIAFFPFSVLLELLARLLAVVGLHCRSLREALAPASKACWSSARPSVAPAYTVVPGDETRADAEIC